MAAVITEVLPKHGLVYSEKLALTEVLCKPKLLPIKSVAQQHLERQMEEATGGANDDEDEKAAQGPLLRQQEAKDAGDDGGADVWRPGSAEEEKQR